MSQAFCALRRITTMTPPKPPDLYEGNPPICPKCMRLVFNNHIRVEMVQPLPPNGIAPLDYEGEATCHDCHSALNLMRRVPSLTFEMARVAVGNDRQEQFRLPGVEMGLVADHIVKPSKPGDLDRHYKWLRSLNMFGDI
jgi:hypothetical protein